MIPNFNSYFESYSGISEMVKNYSCNDIISHILSVTQADRNYLLNYPMGGYGKGKTPGYYQQVLADLKRNITRFDKVYDMLSDEISKQVFTKLIQYRIVPDMRFVSAAYDAEHPQYFDKTIVSCSKEEVFVDCGGFTGDTAEEYIQQYKEYKRMYVYEPSNDNIETCRKNLRKYSNIVIRNCGVGEKNESLPISNSTSASSFIGDVDGDEYIDIISLDDDIKEPVTYIKMDIEGFEIPALLGAKNHIKNDTPKLAICTYHILSDMWEIPLLIHSINPEYDFYFRHYRPDQNWETVVYAIPKKRCCVPGDIPRPKTAVAIPDKPYWENGELTKDCGLIPYFLHKNHGMEVTMLGKEKGPYPSLETYTKGLKMDFLETGDSADKQRYIKEHAKEIDLLIMRGAQPYNFQAAVDYKKLNPKGKIYVGLDANSHWVDRIFWTDPVFVKFMNCCDVIATACKALQHHLNEKWPWKIEYIPNGYYTYGKEYGVPDFTKKENTILTVSRLGTQQKCTDVLLEAFAMIAEQLPEWNLKLIGHVEPEFEVEKERFFEQHPELISRVEFAGVISDREELMKEYRKAKIFALPSSWEGAPNVISEALYGGCVTAVTKYDAWEDAVDKGNCGMATDIFDTKGFAEILMKLCKHPNLDRMSKSAHEYAVREFDMERIVAKVYELLFGG